MTVSPGQWDPLMKVFYEQGHLLLEVEEVNGEERVVRAYRSLCLRERPAMSDEIPGIAPIPGSPWIDTRKPSYGAKSSFATPDDSFCSFCHADHHPLGECPAAASRPALERALIRANDALRKIRSFPVHSEPVGGAYAMQDIAHETLTPNDQAQRPLADSDAGRKVNRE